MTELTSPPPDQWPMISVVMPVLNEEAYLKETMGSVLATDYPRERVEFLLVDGRSEDRTCDIIRELMAGDERIRLLDNPGRTAPAGLNVGIVQAKGEYIIRLDAHSLYAEDYFRRCVETLLQTGADNVGGAMRPREDLTGWQKALGLGLGVWFGTGGGSFHYPARQGEVDTAYLGAFPRVTFERFGRYDEKVPIGEDCELNMRIVHGGGRVYLSPKIKSWYAPRESLRKAFKQVYLYGVVKARVIHKHRGALHLRHFVPSTFLLAVAALATLSCWFATARWALGAIGTVYGAVMLFESVRIAIRGGLDMVWRMPLVFPTFHVAYGIGMLVSFARIVFRRRTSKAAPE